MLLTMPKVMLEMIALGLEHIVGFIFALPVRPAIPDNGNNIIAIQVKVGDERIVIDLFACVFLRNCDFTSVDM